jgi:oligoribonuclease
MQPNPNNLIWIDLEMTGLDPEQEKIIELATIVTDSKLNILAEGPSFVIHQNTEQMAGMDGWNTSHHGQSGLTERVLASATTEADAEAETIAFLSDYVPPAVSPMCGSSICLDRRFLYRYMPKLAYYFHYRNLDVSSIKILANHWAPKIFNGFRKESQHVALQDIRDSIEELRYYREHFFKLENGESK